MVQLRLQPSPTFAEQLLAMNAVPHDETITTIHEVTEPPRDLQDTAEVTLLLELPRDETRRASPDDCLILVDVQIVDRGYLSPGTKLRKVIWSRARMTRQAMLHLLSAADFCSDASSDCIVWKNRKHWPADDGAIRQMAPGDYVHLLVRGHESLSILDIQNCLHAQEQADALRYIFRPSPTSEEITGEESEQSRMTLQHLGAGVVPEAHLYYSFLYPRPKLSQLAQRDYPTIKRPMSLTSGVRMIVV